MKTFSVICKDILYGLAVSALGDVLCAVAFGASGALGFVNYITILAAILFLAAAVFLLRADTKRSRAVRGWSAVLGYIPMFRLISMFGMDLPSFMFELFNPAYVRENGGPAIGNAVEMVFIDLPGVFMAILLAILIARHISEKPQQSASAKEAGNV